MKGKSTGFIPACFSFFLRYSRLRMKYVKADSLSQTFCQLAISSLPLIPFYAIFNILFVFSPIVHLLVRDGSDNVTYMLSARKEVGSDFFAQHLYQTLENNSTDAKQQFCLFFKDNSIILRLFENFFILLPAIRSISYQEMKRLAQHPSFPSLL